MAQSTPTDEHAPGLQLEPVLRATGLLNPGRDEERIASDLLHCLVRECDEELQKALAHIGLMQSELDADLARETLMRALLAFARRGKASDPVERIGLVGGALAALCVVTPTEESAILFVEAVEVLQDIREAQCTSASEGLRRRARRILKSLHVLRKSISGPTTDPFPRLATPTDTTENLEAVRAIHRLAKAHVYENNPESLRQRSLDAPSLEEGTVVPHAIELYVGTDPKDDCLILNGKRMDDYDEGKGPSRVTHRVQFGRFLLALADGNERAELTESGLRKLNAYLSKKRGIDIKAVSVGREFASLVAIRGAGKVRVIRRDP